MTKTEEAITIFLLVSVVGLLCLSFWLADQKSRYEYLNRSYRELLIEHDVCEWQLNTEGKPVFVMRETQHD